MTKFLFEQGDRRRRGAADADDLMHMAGCPQADRRAGDRDDLDRDELVSERA